MAPERAAFAVRVRLEFPFASRVGTSEPMPFVDYMKQIFAGLAVFSLLATAHAQNEAKKTDYGPFFSATIRAPGGNTTVKGIVATLGADKNAYICFDTDLLRVSVGWTGDWLRTGNYLREIVHPQPPEIAGAPVFSTKPGAGWVRGHDFSDPRPLKQGPLPKTYSHYRGLYRHGSDIVFSYSVGEMSVIETPAFVKRGAVNVFTRTFVIDNIQPGWSIVVADAAGEPTVGGNVLSVIQGDKCTAVAVHGAVNPQLEAVNGKLLVNLAGMKTPSATFEVSIWSGAPADLKKFVEAGDGKIELADLKSLTKGGPARWNEPVVTRGLLGTNSGPYVVDTITEPVPNPWNTRTFFGGMDFFPDGRAAICTFHGDVWIVSGIDRDLSKLTWKRFASGLFQPLGLKIVNDTIYVTGRDQITRLHDLNHDGEADSYENFNNDTVVTANYHEFCMDLHTDSHGDFYYFKGAPWTPSVTSPHQGTCLKVSRDGSTLEVFATGFRAPNGSAIGPNDKLTVSDNQGHWMPSSKLNVVHKGGFYGMTPSAQHDLVLETVGHEFITANPSDPAARSKLHLKGWDAGAQAPTNYDQPICWLPMSMDNSSGGQVWVTSDQWGPLQGHLLFMSYGKGTLFEALMEEVDGTVQAGMVRFPFKFPTGIMRGRMNPKDGQVYVCGLRGWQTDGTKDGGFYRVRYAGKPVHMPTALHVKNDGIEIGFDQPIDETSARDLGNYSVEQWNYVYSGNYGSPDVSPDDPKKKGHDKVEVKSAQLAADRKTLFLAMPVRPVMQMKIKFSLKAADGTPMHEEIYNTIHKVPESHRTGK